MVFPFWQPETDRFEFMHDMANKLSLSAVGDRAFYLAVTRTRTEQFARLCGCPRTPFDHIWAMIWSGARENIVRTVL